MTLITQTIRELEYSKLRILDFYLCFPAEIASIELPKNLQAIRPLAREAANKFRGPVSSLRTFRDLEQIQNSATRLLAASDVFDSKKLEEGSICRTTRAVSAEFIRSTPDPTGPTGVLTKFVLTQLSALPLRGTGGLKQRSGLMEYRYDPV
ncbi:ABC-three component system middle component 5 [Variovorax paradoxus]|uniref:ABC-three component system middle component 5 n=1 Tax=Variovorax paradoxus TaxID=34073 RepID=UPI003D646475